jgi:phosphonate transport system substrate-binding protein
MLTDALRHQRAAFSYLPSANFFFLRADTGWRGLASARSARSGMPSQNSVMVVKTSNPATRWQDLRGARLGYINTYCTTSYFAPSILIAREGLPLTTFFKAGPVPAWQGQIDAVVDGSIDVTMVYEDVWLARADNAMRTKIIARVDGLPTPAFIVRSDIGPFASKLKDALLTSPPPTGSGLLYAGFADYQDARMQHFFTELETIPALAPANSQDGTQRNRELV